MNETQTAIRETIRNYVEAYLEADAERLSRAFHAETRLDSVSEQGALERTEMSEWLQNLATRKAKGDIRSGDFEIAFIDVAGESAVAKLSLRLAALEFTDYLSLLHVSAQDGVPESNERRWLITGKIYTAKSR